MLSYYFGTELYFASIAMLAIVGLNLLLLFFLPLARRTIGYSILLLGIVLVLNMARSQYQLALLGARADGQIVNLVESQTSSTSADPDTQNTITYRPVVSFQAADGEQVQFRAGQDVQQGQYAVGQPVSVRYMPAHPGFAEVDSWLSLWRPMLIGSIFDWSLCIGGLLLIRRFGFRRAQ